MNGEKCEFGAQEFAFLGYRLSDAGVAPPEESGRHPGPPTPGQPAGASGFPGDSKLLLPVSARRCQAPQTADGCIGGSKMVKEPIAWTADMVEALTDTKEALAKAALMAHPSPGAEIARMVDASGCHVERPYSSAPRQQLPCSHPVSIPRSWTLPAAVLSIREL
jgi:hypothetical protein